MVLPYEIIRGSEKSRDKLAEHYTNLIADKLAEKFSNMKSLQNLKPEELKEIIDSVLPEKIDYSVTNRLAGSLGTYTQTISRRTNTFCKQNINMHSSFKDWSAYIVHEIRHFIDAITKPAHAVKKLNILTGEFEGAQNIYESILYTKDKFTISQKRKLKNFLKNFSAEEKITILNYYRVSVKMSTT